VSIEGGKFPQFYITPPSPCPYLDGRFERKIFTHLIGDQARALNDTLTHGGFRRSQNIAYRPACDRCTACVSVRVLVDRFEPGRSMRRTIARNDDLVATLTRSGPTREQYSVFRGYIDSRHSDGGMADMSVLDFAAMVEDSFVDTRLVEYRVAGTDEGGDAPDRPGALASVALTDILDDGLSMIYSFYEPDLVHRGLGTYMILEHIERARTMGLPYVYLGYWVAGSPKMDYKRRFGPQERLTAEGWKLARD
jgi:arginine-tRNA-protein transferase